MKRIFAALLALMLLAVPAALAEQPQEDPVFYEGPVLAFSAPRDAEIEWSEMTADSYSQALCAAGSGELIVSAAFASTAARDAYIGELLGDVAAMAVPVTEYDALEGHPAQRAVVTAAFPGENGPILSRALQADVDYVINLVTIDAGRGYLFVAALPEDAYYSSEEQGGLEDVVEAQIESLDIFDPDAKLMLEPETELSAGACQLAGEIIQDAEADPFLIYALDTVTNVRLTTVVMDGEGRPAPDFELGAWSELSFGQAIRVCGSLPDVLPGFAIVYTDASGIEETLYIAMSGLDGSLMFIEG